MASKASTQFEAAGGAAAFGKSDLVIVANRLPVKRVERDGESAWETSPGGLVAALMPILQRRTEQGGAGGWVGWTGIPDSDAEPFLHDGIHQTPVPITEAELEAYYEGLSNRTLWPLYHDVIRPPIYRRSWYQTYERVNQRFAEIAASEAAKNAVVWVQDYHLQLVPKMLRDLRPDLKIGFFLHIPFPSRGLFSQLPWRREMLLGLLGADVVGFQATANADNFADLATWFAGAEKTDTGVKLDGREIVIDAFPISIDSKKIDELARKPEQRELAARFKRNVGGRKIILGVDRMDYTKGIDLRLLAFRELLDTGVIRPDEVVFIQSAVPTRDTVDEYAGLRSKIEELVGQINGDFGDVGQVAVQYLRQSLPLDKLVALYAAADIMLVTPLRDGMNLVAKEYVASRFNNDGVLVLSEFTGAAKQMTAALIVNPHDRDGVVGAVTRAIQMGAEEAGKRMRILRTGVFENDVYHWAESFLSRLTA
ncbi:MAG: trehalose-6-phosphate synthase [Planctomycetota bacterium]